MPINLTYLVDAYLPALRRAIMACVQRSDPCGRLCEDYLDTQVVPELQRLARLPDSEIAARVKALDSEATNAS